MNQTSSLVAIDLTLHSILIMHYASPKCNPQESFLWPQDFFLHIPVTKKLCRIMSVTGILRKTLVREVTKRPKVMRLGVLWGNCPHGDEQCWVSAYIELSAKGKMFNFNLIRFAHKYFSICLLRLQCAFWQTPYGLPFFHEVQFCGVSRLWLSCEQIPPYGSLPAPSELA